VTVFTISTALTLGQESGLNTSYTLTGIIYVGAGHFSARFKDASGGWWAYDGMVNSGQPTLDPITEDAQITTLGDRAMHILLYRLDPPFSGGTSDAHFALYSSAARTADNEIHRRDAFEGEFGGIRFRHVDLYLVDGIGKMWEFFYPLRPSHLLTKPYKALQPGWNLSTPYVICNQIS
jgi:hypothetical protein